MSYTSNVTQVVRLIVKRIEGIQADQIARAAALAVLPEMRRRVHVEGKASDDSQIGTYSSNYMKLRTGNFSNRQRFSKGKNKGQTKDAGVYSRGAKKGQARPKYNRTNDRKVVLSLRRQMENDLGVVAAGNGYGIGYKNAENYKKSQWNEETYKKKVWNLTTGERELATTAAVDEYKRQTSE